MANIKKPLAAALGAAFLASSVVPLASAASNPFSAQQLSGGYDLPNFGAHKEGGCGAEKGEDEGKCGEGKCGEGKDDHKADGEGKDDHKADGEGMEDHKADGEGMEDHKADGEGKCGEGKCGEGEAADTKAAGEGKCGEGKCGG